MKVDEPFTGLGFLMFSWASYCDGAIWASGCCAGVGLMFTACWLSTIAERRNLEKAQ
jgi:hypothetical protein